MGVFAWADGEEGDSKGEEESNDKAEEWRLCDGGMGCVIEE